MPVLGPLPARRRRPSRAGQRRGAPRGPAVSPYSVVVQAHGQNQEFKLKALLHPFFSNQTLKTGRCTSRLGPVKACTALPQRRVVSELGEDETHDAARRGDGGEAKGVALAPEHAALAEALPSADRPCLLPDGTPCCRGAG